MSHNNYYIRYVTLFSDESVGILEDGRSHNANIAIANVMVTPHVTYSIIKYGDILRRSCLSDNN